MKKMMISMFVLLLCVAFAKADLVDAMDNASGVYTYSKAPSGGGADAGKTSVSFDTTNDQLTTAGLLDNGGYFSNIELVGKKGANGSTKRVYFAQDSNVTTTFVITFQLDAETSISEFYSQFSEQNASYDKKPISVTYSYEDESENWITLGTVTSSQAVVASDSSRTWGYILSLETPVTSNNYKIEFVRNGWYHTHMDEVELRTVVPEPLTLSLVGLGGIFFSIGRKK